MIWHSIGWGMAVLGLIIFMSGDVLETEFQWGRWIIIIGLIALSVFLISI